MVERKDPPNAADQSHALHPRRARLVVIEQKRCIVSKSNYSREERLEYPGAFLFVIVPLMVGRTKTAFPILPHMPIDILQFVWYNNAEVRAMLIDSVVQKEAVRNEQMILQYESLIEALPKGSIACRKNGYYYLRYRENGKLYDKYIGKDTDTVDTIREKLALRKHYTEMLSALKQEQKTIHRLLEELA